jgi:integrase
VREQSAHVFESPRHGPLSDMAITSVMRRMEVDAVPHGFRSTFRDWSAELTDYPNELCQAALAHTVADKVEAAYRRGDLFDKRRRMMGDWAKFLAGRRK